jgi:hypothetical protein
VVDVALPFSIRAAAEFSCPDDAGTLINGIKPFDLAGGGQGFNSFDAYLEFIPMDAASTCRVAVSSEEFSPLDIDAVINHPANTLTPSRPLVLPGDNGRMRVWTYTPLDGAVCPPGDPGDPPRYTRNVSAYFKEVNPKLALCHILGLEDCNLQAMRTLDLEFGDLPDDGKLGGFDPRFSEGFLVDQVPDGDYLGTWCGVDPPISNEAPWLSANAGSVVPLDIKPVLADDDPTTDDECGNKTIDALVAVLDIWFIPGVPYTLGDPVPNPAFPPEQLAFEDVNFSGGGSASEYRFEFAEPNNPRRPYSLNWDTVDRDGQKLPEGWYKLNIFDDSASSTGEIYFPPQVVYVYLTNN